MNTVAVLGMGLLGQGFAENLRSKGHTVRVWNRSADKCAPLAEVGAIVAKTPAEAVSGADRVHLVLAADAAVDSAIEALRAGLAKGAFIVDHSTNLPAGVASRFARLRSDGIRYIHAPVFMGPSNSRDATGLMLLSGPAEDEATLRPLLETMTGKVLYLGPEPDKAAKIKITGNGLLFMLTGAMGDLFRMGKACGVSSDEILSLFDQFSPTASSMGRRALAAEGSPVGFAMSMARKDVGLMLETAGAERLTVLPAIAAAMDAAIAEGDGDSDFTTLATR